MEVHGSRLNGHRQEIRCSDCGHRYLIAGGQLSSRCTHCGNIVAVNASTIVNADVTLPPLPESKPNPLAAFAKLPDGFRVQEIISSYQIEWQLWAELVKNFADPHFHSAYLAQAVAKDQIMQASERYREHRSVMTLLADDRWQAEISDLMLGRLEQLSLMRLTQTETASPVYRWWAELTSEPMRARLLKFGWIVAGMIIVLRILLKQMVQY